VIGRVIAFLDSLDSVELDRLPAAHRQRRPCVTTGGSLPSSAGSNPRPAFLQT
jgi:hypothetical protein